MQWNVPASFHESAGSINQMEPFLFPTARPGITEPLKELIELILPAAQKSVLIIDSSLSASCLKSILSRCRETICVRILGSLDSTLNHSSTDGLIFLPELIDSVNRHSVEIRNAQDLAMHVFVIDDTALVVSGPIDRPMGYAVRLAGNDALETIEYAECLWRSGRRITAGKLELLRYQVQSAIARGEYAARDIVALINGRGAFIQVHTGLFVGYRGISMASLLKSHSLLNPTSRSKFCCSGMRRWSFIDSRHFKKLTHLSARVHALSDRGYLKQTPAGPFLLNQDRIKWENDFKARANQFREDSKQYTILNYSSMREESLEQLKQVLNEVKQHCVKDRDLLPFPFSEASISHQIDEFADRYPSVQDLIDSCRIWYIRFGVHPDSLKDLSMTTVYSEIAFMTAPNLDFHNGDIHD